MGNKVSRILKRLFDYPIKRKPICFFRQEDFSSTGEPLPKEDLNQHGPLSEYDKLVQSFYTKLLEQRRQSLEHQEKNEKWSLEKVTNRFPGWNEMTIANLHSLFLLFDQNLNGMLNYDDFSAVLESLTVKQFRYQRWRAHEHYKHGLVLYENQNFAVIYK